MKNDEEEKSDEISTKGGGEVDEAQGGLKSEGRQGDPPDIPNVGLETDGGRNCKFKSSGMCSTRTSSTPPAPVYQPPATP